MVQPVRPSMNRLMVAAATVLLVTRSRSTSSAAASPPEEATVTTPAADRYDRMSYRRCGRSGPRLPAISLGAWETFGGYRDQEVARRCLLRAFDLGITHFDFANNYGSPPGNAETMCGRCWPSSHATRSSFLPRPAT
jgi:hypothetical protein